MITEVEPATSSSASVTFVGTSSLGPYTAEPIPAPPAPASSAAASPTVSPTPSPAASNAEAVIGPIRFAVDLFDLQESHRAGRRSAADRGRWRAADGAIPHGA